jgi:hypothetical protein
LRLRPTKRRARVKLEDYLRAELVARIEVLRDFGRAEDSDARMDECERLLAVIAHWEVTNENV